MISIDHAADSVGQYVANVIVGTLEIGSLGKLLLLDLEILEKVKPHYRRKTMIQYFLIL